MSTSYIAYHSEQQLLPSALQDWLPQSHLAYFINDTADRLNLSAFHARYANGWVKNVLGFRQFSMRGLKKAKAEFKLVCLALNLRRMGAMQTS